MSSMAASKRAATNSCARLAVVLTTWRHNAISHHDARRDESDVRSTSSVANKSNSAAIEIAAFGPVDLNTASRTYGYVTTTPKPGWAQTDLAGRIGKALRTPVGFDTDVNGAALGENRWVQRRGWTPSST